MEQQLAARRIVALSDQILLSRDPARTAILVDEQRTLWDAFFLYIPYEQVIRTVH